ncbi:MAG TPA: insulinase family protein [Firmicutes bacterium]|jgi:predicted Zn-dependent peptidase|nr:insulinase family protein [Bacillota bacterium]
MYQRTVLPNGIRIITESLPHVRSVTLGAWFEVGSRHEQPQDWGMSHFVEHMMFKGTSTYLARDIAEIMDQRGGHLNAFTEKEQTCYYFKVLDEHFETAADLLQDMLLDSLFLPEEVEKEKNVVLEELRMYEDSPEDFVHDLYSDVLWPHHALGKNILGTESTIEGFTSERLKDYVAEHYTADRLVISCVGNISHDQVVEAFAQAFATLPRGAKGTVCQPQYVAGSCRFHDRDIEQVHLCLGAPALSRRDEARYALHLLDTMIGGGVSSLLFQQLREELGLVYSTYSFNSLYSDVGFYGIYGGFFPGNWEKVWDRLCAMFSELPQLLTEEMLVRAKQQVRSSLVLSLESTSSRMFRLARGEIDEGGPLAPEAVLSRIEAVSVEQVWELAEQIYNPQRWSWAAVGPSRLVREDILCRKIC